MFIKELKVSRDFIKKIKERQTDETKLELLGHRDAVFIWKKKGETFNPEDMVHTVRHGCGSMMLWGRFSVPKTVDLVRIER